MISKTQAIGIALLGLVLYAGADAVAVLLLSIAGFAAGSNERTVGFHAVGTLLQVGVLVTTVTYLGRAAGVNFRVKTMSWLCVAVSILVGFATIALYRLALFPLIIAWHLQMPRSGAFFPFDLNGFEFAIEAVFVGVLSPIVQELYFRGWVLSALENINPWIAVIASSLIFSFMHAASGFGTMFYSFFYGIIMGTLLLRARSIVAPSIVHIMINSWSVMYAFQRHPY